MLKKMFFSNLFSLDIYMLNAILRWIFPVFSQVNTHNMKTKTKTRLGFKAGASYGQIDLLTLAFTAVSSILRMLVWTLDKAITHFPELKREFLCDFSVEGSGNLCEKLAGLSSTQSGFESCSYSIYRLVLCSYCACAPATLCSINQSEAAIVSNLCK